jgi:solute carrier family 13 (sodium-dependent dicarboxylate transporter), member 2/3/5
VTLLGAARGIVALGFYEEITNKTVTFFELTYYMFPIGWIMVFVLWGFFMVFFKPEKAVIPGLREKARQLSDEMGSFTRHEIIATVIIFGVILFLSMQSFIPALKPFNKAAVLLVSTILFFIVGILDIRDLEDVPWNIILLFAGAMSMGFCLWQTGAAEWLAINWLGFFAEAHWFVFVMAIAFFVMLMTNFIMNVAAIAISVPVALVVAPYLGVAAESDCFRSPGHCRHAVPVTGGGGPQCHCLQLRPVHQRGVFRLRHSSQYSAHGPGGPGCAADLAPAGHAHSSQLTAMTDHWCTGVEATRVHPAC